jgi:hypothetical protein
METFGLLRRGQETLAEQATTRTLSGFGTNEAR